MEQQWFSRKQVADLVGISVTTVKKMEQQGELPQPRWLYGKALHKRLDVLILLDRLGRENILDQPKPAPASAGERQQKTQKSREKTG